MGVDSAQQIIAEVGPTAATFPSEKCLSSWVGACPGDDETAGVNYSHRSPKGNRQMRRILNQAANAAARTKGSIFEIVYRRSVPRLGHNQAIGAIAHRQCRLIWLILHQGVRHEERGPAVTKRSKQLRTWRMIPQLRSLGYRIEPAIPYPARHLRSDFRPWSSSSIFLRSWVTGTSFFCDPTYQSLNPCITADFRTRGSVCRAAASSKSPLRSSPSVTGVLSVMALLTTVTFE